MEIRRKEAVIIFSASCMFLIITGIFTAGLLGNKNTLEIILDEEMYVDAIRDDFSYRDVSLEGDNLVIKFHYSGGCKSHDFSLIGTGTFSESFPVQTSLVLSHEDNNDSCDSVIDRTLRYSLKPLKEHYKEIYQVNSGTIVLFILGYAALSHLYGWVNLVYYEF